MIAAGRIGVVPIEVISALVANLNSALVALSGASKVRGCYSGV